MYSDFGHAVGNCDRSQSVTNVERPHSDFGHAVGNCDRYKTEKWTVTKNGSQNQCKLKELNRNKMVWLFFFF